jgi:RNA polymerase sigma-70 factor (ECF subfamily)
VKEAAKCPPETTVPDKDPAQPSEFEAFFRAEYPRIARACMLVVGDRGVGEQVAQEAFARALARWVDLRSEEHRLRFTLQVAMNLGRSHLRRRRVEGAWLAKQTTRPRGAGTDHPSDDRLTLRAALTGLSLRQRQCVTLVDYLGVAPESAARLLGLGHGTLRVHLSRGRRTLAERLRTTYVEGGGDG